MLCFLSSKLRKSREGKPDYFVCQWVGVIGDTNAKKVIRDENGRMKVNLLAAKARNVTLTKCIFPATDDAVDEWNTVLDPMVELVVDKDTGEIIEKKRNSKLEDCTALDLCYKQVPLKDISDTVERIQFYSNSGKLVKQNFITVIGLADENGEWAEDLTVEETAINNLNNNLSSGVYTDITNEDTEEKPSPF